jgi:hypothetical protein
VAPADWPGDARRDPGKSLWGQKQKYTTNAAVAYRIQKAFEFYYY